MDELDTREHVKKVQEWLEENVESFPTPGTVTLSAFQIDADRYSGSFFVSLDGNKIPDRFRFGLGSNGKPELFFPMFHSPLGAPASYAAVELTYKTETAIKNLLTEILPKMKPLGLNRGTGEMVLATTHSDSDRIVNKEEYDLIMARISKSDFSASCSI